jgi:hypothetical protein
MWRMDVIHKLILKEFAANNTDEWISVLKISTQLRIKGLRALSIEMLWTKLSPPRKIELAIEYGIETWLLRVYRYFMERAECISVEEEEELGWNRTANLFRLRHGLLLEPVQPNFDLNIRETFASEFADIAAFDHSPISYLRPELCTTSDPTVIQRDEMFYHVDIIFSVIFSS